MKRRLHLLAAATIGLLCSGTPRIAADTSSNVSNLTLIDTLNPDLEVLAATISPAERDSVFWQLNPRNRQGVFMSIGPVANGSDFDMNMLVRPGGGSWSPNDLGSAASDVPSIFMLNAGRFQQNPLGLSNWTVFQKHPVAVFRFPSSLEQSFAQNLNQWMDSGNNQILQSTELYKRHKLPSNAPFPLGPATNWQNNYRQLDTSATKLVIVIHGWQPDAPSDPYAEDDLKVLLQNLHDEMTSRQAAVPGWDLFAYNWAGDAATGPKLFGGLHSAGGTGLGVENGVQSAEIGYQHGLALGQSLRQLYSQDLEKVHFIAHSTGAWVANAASRYLAATSTTGTFKQQITLLDPFNPEAGRALWNGNPAIYSLGGGITDELSSVLGSARISNWHTGFQGFSRFENIYAHTLVVPGTYERYWGGATTGATTSGQIPYSNLKVAETETILASKLYVFGTFDGWAWAGHGGPIRYYAYTVDPGDMRTLAFLNTAKAKKDKVSGDYLRDIAGWKHSMFAQEYAAWEAQQPSLPGLQDVINIQLRNLYGTIPMPSQMNDGDGIIAFDAGQTYTIGVNVNEGWITVFMLPQGGGPAIVAGPTKMRADGGFQALDGSGNVVEGHFNLSQSPPPLVLSLNGATVSGAFDKVTGESAFAGVGAALDAAEETVVFTMVMADGSALAAASGFDLLGQEWNASAIGTVAGDGTVSATSDDGFSVQTVVGEGGEASTPSSFSAPAGVALPVPIGFSGWLGLYPQVPSHLRGAMDDAGSGVANVVAFFQGIDPVHGVLDVGLQDLFRRDSSTTVAGFWRNRMAEGVEGRVRWSRDLATWHDGGGSDGTLTVDLEEEVLAVFGGREWVQVSAIANGAVPESLYLRIEVAVPEQPSRTHPIFMETFGSLANGTPITTSNTGLTYVRVGTQGGSIVARNPSSFDDGSSLVINGPSGGSLNGIGVGSGLQLQSTLDIDFSFDYKLLSTSGQIVFGLGSGDSFTGNGTFNTSQGLFWLQINGTTIQRRSASGWVNVGATVAPNAAGRLEVAVDRVAETMDLYLNGQLVAAALPLTTPWVEPDGFRIYAVNGSSVELDNIEVGAFYLPAHDGMQGVSNKPVKVYILSGQSNMVGFGRIYGDEAGTLNTITRTEGKFPYLIDGVANFIPRQDVYYRGVISALGNAPLAPGFGSSSNFFGPELGFGHMMGWYHDEPVLIIKASMGGRSLLWDLLPPGSARFNWSDGRTYAGYGDSPSSWPTDQPKPDPISWYAGREFDNWYKHPDDWPPPGDAFTPVTNITTVLDDFATEYPQWAAQGFEIAGFGWFHGYNDQFEPGASKYEENMERKIKYLRSYYENRYPGKIVPNAPYAIATLSVNGTGQTGGLLKVANAQLALDGAAGNYPEFAGNVKTMDARGYWRDSSQSPSTQGFHYNHNAETFMLVGEALGRAMIHLKSAD